MKPFKIPVITLILGVLGLAGLSRYWARNAQEAAGVIQSAQQALNAGRAYRARLRALQALSQRYADSARSWQRVAEARGGLVRQLDTALSRATTQRESLTVALGQRDTLRSQAALCCQIAHQWELAFRADSLRADQAEHRVTDLESHLANTLSIADCHIGGIGWLPRCPSRTASFLLGASGASLALILTHH